MTQLLAIEWDAREARVAVGHTRGRDLALDSAFAIPFAARGEEAPTSASLGEKIADALRQRGIGRVETLVAVGRANIELKQFAVPSAPDEELPEIVRFQSLRQFTSLGEDWPLDFVRLGISEAGTAEAESINVLAATISPDLVQQIRETCEAAGLNTKRLVLRPFAAASLVRRQDRDRSQRCRLMVDLLTEEADLTVLDDQHLLMTRTVRLHSGDENESQSRVLMGEIRRTIAAASNQLGGRRVEKVILCGDGADHTTLKSLIEQELSLPVELFDPFAEMQLGGERPKHAGRFAPVLGMLRDEAAGVPHAIDFLHPRKKPEAANTRRRNAIIGATVAAAVLVAVCVVWLSLDSLDNEIEGLKGQLAAMKPQVEKADAARTDELMIQEFLNHKINWLDEMDNLAQRLPPADDVLLTQLYLSTHQPNGAQVKVEGYTREPMLFKTLDEQMRGEGRVVSSTPKPNDLKREKYQNGVAVTIKIPVVGGDVDKQKDGRSSKVLRPTSARKPASATGSATRKTEPSR